ncbi:protein lifeguard 2-like isoform X2 [Pseudophryne corroboree]|uniref:protein lifeguard 2-like isoform X2 n=1 Tax=Pseudophryne corroboree TaxID=495146 RepID=UPI003081E00B
MTMQENVQNVNIVNSNLQLTYVYGAQNPAYPPPVPNYQSSMPLPPPYSVQSPAYSTYTSPDQPYSAFLESENGPKPDAETPPEYSAGLQDSSPFSEQSIRRAFIRKVYTTLTIQLIITFGLVFMFTFWKTLRNWVRDYPYIVYALLPCTFILVMVLACCNEARRKVPLNFILLGIFTLLEGCLLGSLAALFDADAVMWATGATILVTLGLTLFAFQTKWDFTVLSGGLSVFLLVLVSFAILGAIFRSYYLVIDTQLITGGKHRYSLSPEEYIYAALNIYVDIVNLFLLLLQLFGLCR